VIASKHAEATMTPTAPRVLARRAPRIRATPINRTIIAGITFLEIR